MTDLLATLGSLVASLGNVQSAAVMKERLALAAEQLALVRTEVNDLTAQLGEAREQLALAADREARLNEQLLGLQAGGDQLAQRKGWTCDGCGGTRLQRVSTRPDPDFGDLGAKLAKCRCMACGAESEFQIDPGQ
jgi:hypothetical protein